MNTIYIELYLTYSIGVKYEFIKTMSYILKTKHSQSESMKKQKREKVAVDNKNVHKSKEATSSRPLIVELFY